MTFAFYCQGIGVELVVGWRGKSVCRRGLGDDLDRIFAVVTPEIHDLLISAVSVVSIFLRMKL